MNPQVRRIALGLSMASVLASVASAHPGHGDHDFTWSLDHLAEHPAATAAWIVVIGAVVWLLVPTLRSNRPADRR